MVLGWAATQLLGSFAIFQHSPRGANSFSLVKKKEQRKMKKKSLPPPPARCLRQRTPPQVRRRQAGALESRCPAGSAAADSPSGGRPDRAPLPRPVSPQDGAGQAGEGRPRAISEPCGSPAEADRGLRSRHRLRRAGEGRSSAPEGSGGERWGGVPDTAGLARRGRGGRRAAAPLAGPVLPLERGRRLGRHGGGSGRAEALPPARPSLPPALKPRRAPQRWQ